MPKINTVAKSKRIGARITEFENNMLDAIGKVEGLNESETIRFSIRFTARAYNLSPGGYSFLPDCPDCHSQQVEHTADDLMVCEKCGQEFGKQNK